jgi:5'-3' exonuclease
MRTWLILDTNYLAYRAFYSTGELAWGDEATGVIFGVLRDIGTFRELFATDNIIFCFDSRESIRCTISPTYKEKRRIEEATWDDETRARKAGMREQVLRLRRQHLPGIGYANVFQARGYEADDVIASVCQTLPGGDERIIISADEDLWQLLDADTICYNPGKRQVTDLVGFREKWGIEPGQWPDVKALAGCSSDDVRGIIGVGEATAARYLRGELPRTGKLYGKIHSQTGQRVWRRNLPLVRLPYEGTPIFTVGADTVTPATWAAVADGLGFASLRDLAVITNRGRKGYGQDAEPSYSRD